MQITDSQMAKILKDMVIQVDNREKKNQHILDYFDKEGIPYEVVKMDTADYTFILPNYPNLNLDKSVLVERKNSLDEISQNFTKHRERFVAEFERVTTEDLHLVIEGATFRKLLAGSYRSKFPPKSFLASLLTFSIRYNTQVWMPNKADSPHVIYNILYYGLREKILQIRKVE